jgi:hypothetical protein
MSSNTFPSKQKVSLWCTTRYTNDNEIDAIIFVFLAIDSRKFVDVLFENLSIFKVDKFCLNFYTEICCLEIDCNKGNSDLCYTSSFR